MVTNQVSELTATLDRETAHVDALWNACEELSEKMHKMINPLWFIVDENTLDIEFNFNTVAWVRRKTHFIVYYGSDKYEITHDELALLKELMRKYYAEGK